MQHNTAQPPVVLITGAAHRVGAAIAQTLHQAGLNLVLHYLSSAQPAAALRDRLNEARPESVTLVQGNLLDLVRVRALVEEAGNRWGRLDVLVNNASTFYPTPVGTVTLEQWDDLMGTNLRAPFFLAQAAAPLLRQNRGCVVNIVDIHAQRPMKDYPVYSIAKAGLAMLTKTLAQELGPEVRVNGVAPGAILWPEHLVDERYKEEVIARTTLKRRGDPQDVARAVMFFIRDAQYTSGEILAVDGGRSVTP